MKRVCIFCGARPGNSNQISQAAIDLCQQFAQADFDLVYGGGRDGLMGLIAREFLRLNREIIGIRPVKLIEDEEAFELCSELITVADMHERKAKMISSSNIFIALPGGAGTLDEIIEIYTQTKIGFIDKYCAILNTNDFYQPLLSLLEQMVRFEFLDSKQLELLRIHSDPVSLFHDASEWSLSQE